MSPKKKALGVTLLLIIYVLIAAAGFGIAYYVKTNFIDTKSQTEPTPTVTPIPAKSGFKSYQNTEQKFSLQYPEELTVKEQGMGFGVKTVELRSEENQDPAYQADIQILTVPKQIAKTIGQDFDAYYEMTDNSTKKVESPLQQVDRAEMFTKIRNREINSLRALDYRSIPTPNTDNADPEIGTFVEAGNNLIIFATNEDNRVQLDEVLQTFNYNQ